MKTILTFFFLFLSSMVSAEVVDRVLATVNQQPITLYDLNRVISSYNKEMGKLPQARQRKANQEELKREALNHLIEEALLNQEIEKQGIKVTDQEVSEAINTILKRNQISQEELRKELSQKGGTLEGYREEIRDQLKKFRFVAQVLGSKVKVNDEDLNSFYEQNFDKVKEIQKVHISQLVIPLAADASESEFKQAQNKANEIYKKAKKGTNFDQLIKQEGGEGSGDLGEVSFSGISPQLAPALQNLNKGQVTEPIRTSSGFILVKLIDKPAITLQMNEETKEKIRSQVYEMKVQEELKRYVDQLKGKAFIDIRS